MSDQDTSNEKTQENGEWRQHTHLGTGSAKHLEAIAKSLFLLIEEEKRMTEEKIKKTKELLERMRVS